MQKTKADIVHAARLHKVITVLINLSLAHSAKYLLCFIEESVVYGFGYEKLINIFTEQITMSGDSIWGNIN